MKNLVFNFLFNLREWNLNTPKTLGERLKYARKPLGTQGALSEATGISQNAISNYENNKRQPKVGVAQILCDALGISPRWLLTGEGEMRSSELIPKPEAIVKHEQSGVSQVFPVVYESQDGEDLINVPLVAARLSAGVGSLQVDGDVESYVGFSSAFLHRKGNPKRMVVMRVEGDSMSPEIRDGDMVLLDQSKTGVRLGRIFAVGFGEAIYLKRIDMEPGKLLLKSVNPAYSPVEIFLGSQEAESFRVIGEVLWVGREY